MKKVYVFLADGFETIEALTPIDVLFRSNIEVKTVSITDSLIVKSSHKVPVTADMTIFQSDFCNADAIVLPGGYPGYDNLAKSQEVGKIVKQYQQSGKIIAAICAAPSVLYVNNIAKGSQISCHSCIKDIMTDYTISDNGVSIDNNIITAAGAGWSLEFAFAIANALTSKDIITDVMGKMEIPEVSFASII